MKQTKKGPLPMESKGRLGGLQLLLFLFITVALTVFVTFFVLRVYIFPSEFRPVTLSAAEESILNKKLERLDAVSAARESDGPKQVTSPRKGSKSDREGALVPERYNEEVMSRELILTERELNALIAKNTDLAKKLVLDLSDDLISAKLLLPVNEDFPVLGGKVLKVRAGIRLSYEHGKPIVALKGISVMGVPLPNAWLGGLKNIDLVKEYNTEPGFWKFFAEGVGDIRVVDGSLRVRLKE